MRKVLCVLLALGLLMSVAGSVYGDGLVRRGDRYVSTKTVVFENLKTTAIDAASVGGNITAPGTARTLVTEIDTNDDILGFSVCAFGGATTGKGAIAAFVDDANTTFAGENLTGLIVEVEASVEESNAIWFPYPKRISNGLVVTTGASNTIVTIFYVEN